MIISCIIDCYDSECNKGNKLLNNFVFYLKDYLFISFAFILNYSIVYIVFSSYYKKKIMYLKINFHNVLWNNRKFLGKITWDESFNSSIESSINNYQDNSNLNQSK